MADSCGTPSSSGMRSLLLLTVEQQGIPRQEFFLQHGLTIGRNPSNAIAIDDPAVERIHALIQRGPDGALVVECQDEGATLVNQQGQMLRRLELHDGVTFSIGAAGLRCTQHKSRAAVQATNDPWQVSCPRCRANMEDLPRDTSKCPQCGLHVIYVRTGEVQQDSHQPATGRSQGFTGWLPKQVGPYAIRAYVAQGGMGIVLRGLHDQTDTPAAVKLLRGGLQSDPLSSQRFAMEVTVLTRLRHPNLVMLQDHGQDGHLLWLAMDWIDGRPLSSLLAASMAAHQMLEIPQINSIMQQIYAGLAYLHGEHIVHRDLKPGNILAARDGSVKIADVGIAKSLLTPSDAATLTRTGSVVGTDAYMAPEQMEGRFATPASDIYSLGVIWYELLTGRLPRGAFTPAITLRPDCPPAWNNTIMACLAPDTRNRPDLPAIRDALASPAGGGPAMPASAAGPHTVGGGVPVSRGRSLAAWLTAAALAVATIGGTALAVLLGSGKLFTPKPIVPPPAGLSVTLRKFYFPHAHGGGWRSISEKERIYLLKNLNSLLAEESLQQHSLPATGRRAPFGGFGVALPDVLVKRKNPVAMSLLENCGQLAGMAICNVVARGPARLRYPVLKQIHLQPPQAHYISASASPKVARVALAISQPLPALVRIPSKQPAILRRFYYPYAHGGGWQSLSKLQQAYLLKRLNTLLRRKAPEKSVVARFHVNIPSALVARKNPVANGLIQNCGELADSAHLNILCEGPADMDGLVRHVLASPETQTSYIPYPPPARSAGNFAAPVITGVSPITAAQNQRIVIKGRGFGIQQPFNGDTPVFQISDITRGWNAGNDRWPRAGGGNWITVHVTKWTDTEIVLHGFGGDYGGWWSLAAGDNVEIDVWNAQTERSEPAVTRGPAWTVGSGGWTTRSPCAIAIGTVGQGRFTGQTSVSVGGRRVRMIVAHPLAAIPPQLPIALLAFYYPYAHGGGWANLSKQRRIYLLEHHNVLLADESHDFPHSAASTDFHVSLPGALLAQNNPLALNIIRGCGKVAESVNANVIATGPTELRTPVLQGVGLPQWQFFYSPNESPAVRMVVDPPVITILPHLPIVLRKFYFRGARGGGWRSRVFRPERRYLLRNLNALLEEIALQTHTINTTGKPAPFGGFSVTLPNVLVERKNPVALGLIRACGRVAKLVSINIVGDGPARLKLLVLKQLNLPAPQFYFTWYPPSYSLSSVKIVIGKPVGGRAHW